MVICFSLRQHDFRSPGPPYDGSNRLHQLPSTSKIVGVLEGWTAGSLQQLHIGPVKALITDQCPLGLEETATVVDMCERIHKLMDPPPSLQDFHADALSQHKHDPHISTRSLATSPVNKPICPTPGSNPDRSPGTNLRKCTETLAWKAK